MAAAQIALLQIELNLLHGGGVYEVNVQLLVRIAFIARILTGVQLRGAVGGI